ncbi:MAG: hypothetical protein L0Z62_46040, partial [Gemmataceae bacterium]|nr:hypothetical protein [Gemmataceae bacterium]
MLEQCLVVIIDREEKIETISRQGFSSDAQSACQRSRNPEQVHVAGHVESPYLPAEAAGQQPDGLGVAEVNA